MLRNFANTFLLVAFALTAVSHARGESPSPSLQVQTALDDLNRWLGDDTNGQQWNNYLDNAELKAELAKDDAADPATLDRILAKYSSNTAGLDRPRFQAVKTALASWRASLAQPEPGALAASARQAQFKPITPQEAAEAKRALATAITELEGFLNRSGRANADRWKAYLGWNDLVAIVQSNEAPNAEVVDSLSRKLTSNVSGLEFGPFVRTRAALERYAGLATAAADPMLAATYQQRIEELAKRIEAYEQNPASGDDALEIGRSLAWINRSSQAADFRTAAGRQLYRHNLFGYASQRFAASGIEDNVDRVSQVRDNILGTDIYGQAHLVGRTTLALNENPRVASMSILLGATANSNTVGYNGPVTIYATGVTQVAGTKNLQMDARGLFDFPATACCTTNTNINDICAKCRLIERIAWKRAGKQKGQAQAIAADHAEVRISGEMDRESAKLIAEQNQRYNEKFRDPLIRRNAFPQELRFSSRKDRAEVRMLQAGPGLIGAPTAPPPVGDDHDLAVRMHESLVVNFGQSALGGYELTDVRLEKLIRDDLEDEVPDELKVTLPDGTLDPDKEPWSITFARELPVRAKFQDGGLWMAIRADRFTRGEGDTPGTYKPAITELVEISAKYTIEKTDAGANLRRDGDVQIRFPNRQNPDQITIRDSATVTFMRRKFRNMFKEEFIGEGLQFKGRWAKAGTLRLRELRSADAWLTLGWQMPARESAAPPPATAAANPPAATGAE